jgi:hypothetical protein
MRTLRMCAQSSQCAHALLSHFGIIVDIQDLLV